VADYKSAFEREFSYKKGKINYFDPDFIGSIKAKINLYEIVFQMKFECFKDKLYLRVMMIMFKKLIRFVMLFDMINKAMHKQSGKNFRYSVEFVFRYGQN